MTAIRVVLAEAHDLVRAGISALLQQFAGVEVVAEAASGHETLCQVKSYLPDVAVIDERLPELNGLDVTARVVPRFPSVHVLLLSGSADNACPLSTHTE